jgi:hypothetical protein
VTDRSSASDGPQGSGRISDNPEGWVVGWLRRIASDIEVGDWTLEAHSQCWSRPFTDYEFTVTLRVQDQPE